MEPEHLDVTKTVALLTRKHLGFMGCDIPMGSRHGVPQAAEARASTAQANAARRSEENADDRLSCLMEA